MRKRSKILLMKNIFWISIVHCMMHCMNKVIWRNSLYFEFANPFLRLHLKKFNFGRFLCLRTACLYENNFKLGFWLPHIHHNKIQNIFIYSLKMDSAPKLGHLKCSFFIASDFNKKRKKILSIMRGPLCYNLIYSCYFCIVCLYTEHWPLTGSRIK